MRVLAIMALALLISNGLSAQLKFERESRLQENEVPPLAYQFIQAVEIQSKVKWYYEENLEGNSVEAKYRLDKVRYSVEFDTLGNIQDVEIEVAPSQLDPRLLSSMENELGKHFSKHQWRKIQRQYQGDSIQLQSIAGGDIEDTSITPRYEAEIKGRKETGIALYEITFDQEGQLLQQRQIILKNANHLEY